MPAAMMIPGSRQRRILSASANAMHVAMMLGCEAELAD